MVFLNDGLLEKLQKVEGPSYKEIMWIDGNIYGSGGGHRYYINTVSVDGELKFENLEPNEVLFSSFHSRQKSIIAAKAAGFRIFD